MQVLFVIQIITVVLMVGTILMQKTTSDGLLSGNSPDSFLSGRASANILSRTTAILATIFIANSLIMGYLATHSKRADAVSDRVFSEETTGESTPAANDAVKSEQAPSEVPANAKSEKPASEKEAAPASVPVAD